MSPPAPPDYARERALIEKLEFRIAAADGSEKLQKILITFLAPLILKLSTEDTENRNLTIKVCQYVNQRLKIDQSIQLPVEALSQAYQDSSNAFVRQFSVLFLQQGLSRLSEQDAVHVLPTVLRSSLDEQNQSKIFPLGIDLLFRVLQTWKIPQPGSSEESELVESFRLSEQQVKVVSGQLSRFLLYDPKDGQAQGLQAVYQEHWRHRGKIAPGIASFIQTGIFSNDTRFVPALILVVDANSTASSRADTIFKQHEFDLESKELIGKAFELYSVSKPKLKTHLLTVLARSKQSTQHTDRIIAIVEDQLSTPVLNLEAAKLRAAMFNYLIWTIRINPNLNTVAKRLLSSLKEFIEVQGWPTANTSNHLEIELRAKAYESIGLLASASTGFDAEPTSTESSNQSMFSLVAWLFTSLRCDTTPNARHSIEDGLSRLITKATNLEESEVESFRSLLLWNTLAEPGDEDPVYMFATKNPATYAAVRFTNKILSFRDADARIINIFALGSNKREVVEEAQRGLDPTWYSSTQRMIGQASSATSQPPTFGTFMSRLVEMTSTTPKVRTLLEMVGPLKGLASFSKVILATEAWAGTSHAINNEPDVEPAIDQRLDNDSDARELFRECLGAQDTTQVSALLEICLTGLSKGSVECGRTAMQLVALSQDDVLRNITDNLSLLERASAKSETRQIACRLVGTILSVSDDWEQYYEKALSGAQLWQGVVGQQLSERESQLLTAACILSRANLRGKSASSGKTQTGVVEVCEGILTQSKDKSLRNVAMYALGQIGLCATRGESVFMQDTIVPVMLDEAKKENETAVSALGRVLSLVWVGLGFEEAAKYLDKLYELHEIRRAEYHFALGEALAVASLWFGSASALPEQDVLSVQSKRDNNQVLFKRLMDDILEKSKSTKPALKKATGIWLLSLIQFCKDETLVKPYLQECQSAFSRLLTDRDDIVQETGSRGLGIVYEKGDRSLREDLVRELVQSFTGNNAKTSGTVTQDTQLFEPGALPTENGQSVTTYKDIVSLAQEMGDPSLVYRFMNLASNNAIWSSRAAFGRFGLSGVLADSSYLKENKKFYPKLFRYRFDPNPNVQRSMNDIWKALVKDSNATIDENFDLIIEDLLKSILAGREWRVREASCAAISDLIQGREVEKFENYLDDVWKVTFKVLDDIKESVRQAAMKLCRTLTSMLLRNLDVGEGTSIRATSMLNHAMPFLLDQMDGTAGQEIQQYAIVTLLDIVKKAPPRSLRSYAPSILEKFVNSLSSLEHESINYLHLNADKYGLTAEKLDTMRVSSLGTSPVTEAIEKCLESLVTTAPTSADTGSGNSNFNYFEDALKRLESSFKSAIGLPSRVGLSRVMVTLTMRHQVAFKPYADRFVKLTRKSIVDRNATISQSFSTALAYLLRLASEKELRQTLTYVKKLYFEFQDTSQRAIAGEILQAISKASNDVFARSAAAFLPIAFIGRNDLDEDTRGRFQIAWDENVGGPRALRLYLTDIADLLQKHIQSHSWPIKHACCFAVADLVTKMQADGAFSQSEAGTIWPLMEESLNGKTWEGKSKVIEAWPKFVKGAEIIWPEHGKTIIKITLREAKRRNAPYRPSALHATSDIAKTRRDVDLSAELIPYLVETMSDISQDATKMELDGTGAENDRMSGRLIDETLRELITCVFAILRVSTKTEDLEQALQLIRSVLQNHKSFVGFALYQEAAVFCDYVSSAEEEKSALANQKSKVPEPAPLGLAGTTQNNDAVPDNILNFCDSLACELYGADTLDSHVAANENSRLQAATLVHRLLAMNLIKPKTKKIVAPMLKSWKDHERSKLVQVELMKAVARDG